MPTCLPPGLRVHACMCVSASSRILARCKFSERGRERERGEERRSTKWKLRRASRREKERILDFHFNWTQRNIILNARNASEAPIKWRRHFTLSPRTSVRNCPRLVARLYGSQCPVNALARSRTSRFRAACLVVRAGEPWRSFSQKPRLHLSFVI